VKLFLKGDRCLSPKCAMIKRPYAPGVKAKKRRSNLSEYAKELKEKQKLKNWYNLSEKQFSNYVRGILNKGAMVENASDALLRQLESRFDNVVFQMGVTKSRTQARQLISHGFFLVNERKNNIPSLQIKKGDKIEVHSKAVKKRNFQGISSVLKKHKTPSWIRWTKIERDKLEAEIIGAPSLEEMAPPAEISSIFEFYSK